MVLSGKRGVPRLVLFLFLMVAVVFPVFGSDAAAEAHLGITHQMMILVLQIGIIIFAGYGGLKAARRLGFPGIMGELAAGILIGPFVLGGIPVPGFPTGLFAHSGGAVAVAPELYGFAMVASVVLLFLSGLQTDLRLFLRFAFKGGFVGLGGAAVSLAAGLFVGSLKSGTVVATPGTFFLGVVAIATSMDITARILNEHRKLASPEGVTILAASVIEDVIGITFLAVLMGIDNYIHESGVAYGAIVGVALRALLVWLGFTVLGILFSHRIAALLKREPNLSQIAVLAMGLALVVSGLFEVAGLAMIIGAYVVGLSFSNTDLSYVIQERIEVIHNFFDPIFFTVMGMIINVQVLFSFPVLKFGLLFGVLAIAAKVIGCGIPALLLGFNKRGSLRISLGMSPRGEVALIIAGIGLSAGFLDDMFFGVVILMTLMTTLITPPLFSRVLSRGGRATREETALNENVNTDFELGNREINDYLLATLLQNMRNEGFYIHSTERDQRVFQMRQGTVYITLTVSDRGLHFSTQKEDVTFINNLVYESLLTLQSRVDHLRKVSKPVEMGRTLVRENNRTSINWYSFLEVDCITLKLRSHDKKSVICELVELLEGAEKLTDKQAVLDSVLAREESMSTGMPLGLAIPHGHSAGVKQLCVAVGLAPEGIEFDALDGEPSRVFFMIVSPEDDPGPHLQVLSGIAGILNSEEAVRGILGATSRTDLISFMVKNSKK